MLTAPELTFACELDPVRLAELFSDGSVIEHLRALAARLIVVASDFSDERAAVVRQLNDAGVPLIGLPLFPESEGYYFTVENAPRATEQYQGWKDWSEKHGLRWDWVGL